MPASRRNQLLARLHCIKKEHGWDDDEYRDILEARSGKRSAADLDDAALARVIAALGVQKSAPAAQQENEWAWVNTAVADKRPYLWKIRRVCLNLRIPRGQQIAYAEGVAARIFGSERHLKMMSETELWKLIGPLERTARYKEAKA
jgi:hypothetical protein